MFHRKKQWSDFPSNTEKPFKFLLTNVKWCQKDYSEICTRATFLPRGPLSLLTYVQLVPFHASCHPDLCPKTLANLAGECGPGLGRPPEVAGGAFPPFVLPDATVPRVAVGTRAASVRGL